MRFISKMLFVVAIAAERSYHVRTSDVDVIVDQIFS